MTSPEGARPIPSATYRLQLGSAFGFRDAAALAPYLARLGVSHVYFSPYLRSRPGSTHGYDIVGHGEPNPELGSAADFAALSAALRDHGLGQIVDIVPNHMGVGGADNPWWLDVLEWGAQSQYARWFDIDWEARGREGDGKLLVPFLGNQFGIELAAGALRLSFDAEAGSFAVWAYDTHKLPISPLDYDRILGRAHPQLERFGDAFAHLGQERPHTAARARELQAELAAAVAADPELRAAVVEATARFAGRTGDIESWSRLGALIARQHWRPAYFRVAADDINYRRFFNVNDLAGIRMELPELFEQTHDFLFALIADGVIDGLRIDHIDGLLDPRQYCLRLRERAPRPIYLVVEKILAPHERLPPDWQVDGTTGYEFANLVTGLLIDPAGEAPLTHFYAEFTGQDEDFADLVRSAKIGIMENEMAGELSVLAREAYRVARSNPMTADFTHNLVERALKQIIAAFPVYRTYVDGEGRPSEADRRDIDWALAQARRRDAALDPSVFDFLHGLLTCDLVAEPGSGFSRIEVVRVAMRAQQFSGPVMAKGLEDTAFYRFNRMLALNEVGGHPAQFSVSVAAFHQANRLRAQHAPHAMLTTATHDTKRGEDARARLAVISEIPDEWMRQVTLWSRMLRGPEGASGSDEWPDTNDEYAFYQVLLGAWPVELMGTAREPDALRAFCERVEGAMIKAVREAKVHTTWVRPDEDYEGRILRFVRHALDAERTNPFLESFAAFQAGVAGLGARNSIVQTVLKLTVPGVPDIYQGAESWDLSLVDPDNRRPVDFAQRARLLDGSEAATDLGALLGAWQDGTIKLRTIAALLRLRSRCRGLFETGTYTPVTVSGPAAERVCAFLREGDGETVLVAVLLHPARGADDLPETTLALPAGLSAHWASVLDGASIEISSPDLSAADLFADLPAAVLHAAA
jgi:(1->4)-alpha-D-glucan 1-alpha-D-glucosylmutase